MICKRIAFFLIPLHWKQVIWRYDSKFIVIPNMYGKLKNWSCFISYYQTLLKIQLATKMWGLNIAWLYLHIHESSQKVFSVVIFKVVSLSQKQELWSRHLYRCIMFGCTSKFWIEALCIIHQDKIWWVKINFYLTD